MPRTLDPNDTSNSADLHAFLCKSQKESDSSELVSAPTSSPRHSWEGVGLAGVNQNIYQARVPCQALKLQN